MKTPCTVRIEADLLTAARLLAKKENRTLTNFIETLLRGKLDVIASAEAEPSMPKKKSKA